MYSRLGLEGIVGKVCEVTDVTVPSRDISATACARCQQGWCGASNGCASNAVSGHVWRANGSTTDHTRTVRT